MSALIPRRGDPRRSLEILQTAAGWLGQTVSPAGADPAMASLVVATPFGDLRIVSGPLPAGVVLMAVPPREPDETDEEFTRRCAVVREVASADVLDDLRRAWQEIGRSNTTPEVLEENP